MNEALLTAAVIAIGYLLGCISTGILISKSAGVNIREEGSRNTGASNVLRVLGIGKGAITFLGDSLKAVLACWIGSLILPGTTFGIERFGIMIGGLGAIIGHNWPVFFSFRGGKGIASSTAVVLFVDPLLGGIAIAVCVILIAWKRYISLGSLALLFMFMVLTFVFHFDQWFACAFSAVLFSLGLFRHLENIKRLLTGAENKIGKRVKSSKTQKK